MLPAQAAIQALCANDWTPLDALIFDIHLITASTATSTFADMP
jgi:hypothetical protein